MMPQPSSQKPMEVTANTMKFFDRIFTQFFARHIPDSTVANPRFMKNTSMPVTRTHTVSAITLSSAFDGGPAGAGAGWSCAAAPSLPGGAEELVDALGSDFVSWA